MNETYSLLMLSARAVGVNTYFREPGMISSENRRSDRRSLCAERGLLDGKNADIVVEVHKM